MENKQWNYKELREASKKCGDAISNFCTVIKEHQLSAKVSQNELERKRSKFHK